MDIEKRRASWKAYRDRNKEKNAARYKVWREKNREKVREYQRSIAPKHDARRRARKYGITIEQLEKIRTTQNNKCAICGNPPRLKDLHVDHCHATKVVRGLLCERCNRGIGFFMEDISLLESAIFYLLKNHRDFS